jgi:hypothetical protein
MRGTYVTYGSVLSLDDDSLVYWRVGTKSAALAMWQSFFGAPGITRNPFPQQIRYILPKKQEFMDAFVTPQSFQDYFNAHSRAF